MRLICYILTYLLYIVLVRRSSFFLFYALPVTYFRLNKFNWIILSMTKLLFIYEWCIHQIVLYVNNVITKHCSIHILCVFVYTMIGIVYVYTGYCFLYYLIYWNILCNAKCSTLYTFYHEMSDSFQLWNVRI